MKKLLLFFSVCLFPASFVAGQQVVEIYPKIKEVTVYLSGAETKYREVVPLKKGENMVVFRGISPSLVESSIQLGVESNVEILSIFTNFEEQSPENLNPQIKLLNDSILSLEEQLEMIKNQVDAYQMEKNLLIQNLQIGGAQHGTSMADLSRAADFFRERTLKINNAITSLNKEIKLLNATLEHKKRNLQRELTKVDVKRYRLTAVVHSQANQSVEFNLSHLVANTYWEAFYDIVATEVNKPVTLNYKAEIFNNTHVNWNDVKLRLSTGDVSLDATRPFLTAWILNYTSQANEGLLDNKIQNRLQKQEDKKLLMEEEEIVVSEWSNTSFEIGQKHSVPSDNKPYHIHIQQKTLPAFYEYLAVPKMDLSAFLVAKVTGWEKLSLIDGKANVYFGNVYIGQSNINTRHIGDTLELSLGRDNQILVSRTKIEDKGSTSFLGSKREESLLYEIQIRNNRKTPVFIKVHDQIPVSQEKDISVEVVDISGATLDAPSGRLEWRRNLGSGEAVKYQVAFSVRYPKNRNVNIRKTRVIRTPRYRH